MYKIKIYTVGKNKELWLDTAIEEYEKRLKSNFQFDWFFAKNDEGLKKLIEKEKHYIALDPLGYSLPSDEFSKLLYQQLLENRSRLTFVIGGDEGLDISIKANAYLLFSLSSMTFTHQITRLILTEQIYRAEQIQKGSPYHK
ncbi:MAG: 23S rRNA (pseudouridine(1915)-N(3))-methyltransferase RlmH [Simkaniaceae bacterium]